MNGALYLPEKADLLAIRELQRGQGYCRVVDRRLETWFRREHERLTGFVPTGPWLDVLIDSILQLDLAPAFVGKGSQSFQDGAGGALSCQKTGVTIGNLVVALMAQSNPVNTNAIPTPAGFSVAEAPVATSALSYKPSPAIFYKIATATTETASSTPASGSYAAGILAEFSGIDPTPLDVHTNNNGTASTSGNTGTTGTTAVADSLVIAVGHAEDAVGNTSNFSSPASSGYTSLATTSNNAVHIAWDGSYKILVATGTQSGAWTWTTSSAYNNAIAVFKGTGGGGAARARLISGKLIGGGLLLRGLTS